MVLGEIMISPGQEKGNFLEEVEFELGLPVVGLSIWEILGAMGLSCFCGFLKSRPRV